MEHVLSAAEQILRNAGVPALRLTCLATDLRGALGAATVETPRLRALLEAHPDRFRVLDPWRGPWRLIGRHPETGEQDPWVVAVRDLGDAPGASGAPPMVRKVRESVRWLALNVDTTSPRSIIRWQAILLEGMEAEQALDRAA